MNPAPRLALAMALSLSGCTSTGSHVSEYLDPQTAVTIRALTAPIVYAHDAPQFAANARDYLSLGVVEINNMGARKHYLALVSWSTIDRTRIGVGPAPVPERVEIQIGGSSRELTPVSHEPRSLGIGTTPFRPDNGYSSEAWYRVTPAELRAMAAVLPGSIGLVQGADHTVYQVWRATDGALQEFVRDIPDSAVDAPARR